MDFLIHKAIIFVILFDTVMTEYSNLPLVINTWPFSNATVKGEIQSSKMTFF